MISNSLLNQIASIGVQATISILSLAGTAFIGFAVSYIAEKKDALIGQIGVDNYNSTYNIAKGVFYAVEQQFKFVPAAAELKKQLFDKLLLDRIPGLTQDEIDHFREAICGEINSQLKSSNLLVPAYDPSIDKADVKITEKPIELDTESTANNQTHTNTLIITQ